LPKDCVASIESAWGSLMKDMGYELSAPTRPRIDAHPGLPAATAPITPVIV
jgi:hypothetical protein